MAKVLRLSALPVVEQQAEDTVLAIRNGEPVRIPAFTGGELPELAQVAITGEYSDLKGTPTLGTASSMDASEFATAAQGVMAATALQPASIGQTIQAYSDVLAATTASFTTAYKAKLDGLDTALDGKVDKVSGKGLSTNDYTNAEKSKLAGIEAGAQVNAVPVDNLTTPDATQPLSANQGRVIKGLIDSINTLLQSDDSNLDELQEIVDYIKLNRAELDALGIDSIAGLRDALDGKQPLSTVLTNTTASFTSALLTKLQGIQAGAQVNPSSTDGVPEGENLYFTNSRAVSAIKSDADWKAANWDEAYSWGNHASAGYALSSSLVWNKDDGGLASYGNKIAAGNSLSGSRLNSGGGPRAFNLIDTNATVRVWRYAASGAAFELINGTNDDSNSTSNAFWDIALAGVGTGSGSRLLFRNRTGGNDTIMALSGNGNVGIGVASPSQKLYVNGNIAATGTINGRNLDADGQIIDGLPADVASQSWVNAQLADLGGDVKVWIATTGALTKNAFHKVNFSSNRTLTLPASPTENDFVEIYADGGNSTGSTIARNGQTIMGLAENLSIDAPMTHIRLVYSGSTWRIAS